MPHEAPTQDAASSGDKLLSAAQVAERLSMSLTAVYRLARNGDLPSHRFGQGKVRPRGVRIPESAVEAYLNGSLITPAEEAAA